MGDSNGAWGELAKRDDELTELFDQYERLPDPGVNPALDSFVARKNIDIPALVRLGARLDDYNVLAFAFPGGIKFRDMVTDHRWSYAGSEWVGMKRLPPQTASDKDIAIVAEGETDGARLTMLYPEAWVYVLPAGADPRPHTAAYAKQLSGHALVLMAQDADEAGGAGATELTAALVGKVLRWLPPAPLNDWGSLSEAGMFGDSLDACLPPLPDPALVDVPIASRLLVNAGDLLDLEPPPIVSYFDHALLPIGGQLVIHGWAKSFKSYLGLDLAAALATAQPWCNFEPLEEPIRVAMMQYEIPWPFYQQRIRQLIAQSEAPELFRQNFLTWTPMQRPNYRAGNKAQEDQILAALQEAGVEVFVLDPIRRATGAIDLNSEKDVRPLLAFYERLQGEGIAVITCHHDNKTAGRSGGGDPLGMTGAGAFAGDADSIVSVALPKGEDQESAKRDLHFTFRNAPSIGPRGFTMEESGLLVYGAPHEAGDDVVTPGSVDEAI